MILRILLEGFEETSNLLCLIAWVKIKGWLGVILRGEIKCLVS